MAKPASIMKLDIHYYDDREPDRVICGNWEYLRAQRKFNKSLSQAGKDVDLEYFSFIAFLAAKREGILTADVKFEDWIVTVSAVENYDEKAEAEKAEGADAEGESPAPLDE